MKIFVSSLISGFEEFRGAARAAVQALGHEVVMAEDFAAKASSPQVACLQGLRSSDLVVLILGERYGTVPPGSSVSPTHEEFLEARESKPLLLFVQEGMTPEPKQAALLTEAQGWRGGLFRAGFSDPDDLRNRVTQAIHRYELAHATAPLDVQELQGTAKGMLAEISSRGPQRGARLVFALVGGPRQQVLRPSELESETLSDALHQDAMFGSPKLFERSEGVDVRIEGDVLVVAQESGACLRVGERGQMTLTLPLERPTQGSRGFGGAMPGIVEESVLKELGNAIAFCDKVLDRVDSTQRLVHVALAARILASDFMGWRTQAEQDANPNSGTMRIGKSPENAVCIDRPRGALKFDGQRLAEDLLVPLRRQWKA